MYDHQYFKEMRAGANLKKADEERFFDAFIKIAASPVDAAILDIGCGRGDLLARFVASGVRDVYGCDFSPTGRCTQKGHCAQKGHSIAYS